jgi:hypothetical protein
MRSALPDPTPPPHPARPTQTRATQPRYGPSAPRRRVSRQPTAEASRAGATVPMLASVCPRLLHQWQRTVLHRQRKEHMGPAAAPSPPPSTVQPRRRGVTPLGWARYPGLTAASGSSNHRPNALKTTALGWPRRLGRRRGTALPGSRRRGPLG